MCGIDAEAPYLTHRSAYDAPSPDVPLRVSLEADEADHRAAALSSGKAIRSKRVTPADPKRTVPATRVKPIHPALRALGVKSEPVASATRSLPNANEIRRVRKAQRAARRKNR